MGKRLAVIFPGIGYHCDKPILYYSRKLAKEQEYKEIISLEYSYTEKNIRGNEKRMKEVFDVLYQQAEKLLETIDFSKYENCIFLMKSSTERAEKNLAVPFVGSTWFGPAK